VWWVTLAQVPPALARTQIGPRTLGAPGPLLPIVTAFV
jgi:hypothetical protein